jgi:hypothetical protein
MHPWRRLLLGAATIGGLFVTTGSIAVTALATALTALLGVCVAVNHRI